MANKSTRYKKKARGSARKVGRRLAPYNRQEPYFLGRDYAATSFQALHTMNKYNHAVEGYEQFKKYSGRVDELERQISQAQGVNPVVSGRLQNLQTGLNQLNQTFAQEKSANEQRLQQHQKNVNLQQQHFTNQLNQVELLALKRSSVRPPSSVPQTTATQPPPTPKGGKGGGGGGGGTPPSPSFDLSPINKDQGRSTASEQQQDRENLSAKVFDSLQAQSQTLQKERSALRRQSIPEVNRSLSLEDSVAQAVPAAQSRPDGADPDSEPSNRSFSRAKSMFSALARSSPPKEPKPPAKKKPQKTLSTYEIAMRGVSRESVTTNL